MTAEKKLLVHVLKLVVARYSHNLIERPGLSRRSWMQNLLPRGSGAFENVARKGLIHMAT